MGKEERVKREEQKSMMGRDGMGQERIGRHGTREEGKGGAGMGRHG